MLKTFNNSGIHTKSIYKYVSESIMADKMISKQQNIQLHGFGYCSLLLLLFTFVVDDQKKTLSSPSLTTDRQRFVGVLWASIFFLAILPFIVYMYPVWVCVCAVLCRFLISMGNRFIWMIKASNVCLMIPNIKVRTALQHKMRAQTQFKSPYNLAYLCICIQTATQYTMD